MLISNKKENIVPWARLPCSCGVSMGDSPIHTEAAQLCSRFEILPTFEATCSETYTAAEAIG